MGSESYWGDTWEKFICRGPVYLNNLILKHEINGAIWGIGIYQWRFRIMKREEALTQSLTIQSGPMEILLTVKLSSIPVQAQKSSLCFLIVKCSIWANLLKHSNTVITHHAMTFQNLFVLKQYRSFLLLQFRDTIYSIPASMVPSMNVS